MKDPQQNAHVDALDQHDWKDWPKSQEYVSKTDGVRAAAQALGIPVIDLPFAAHSEPLYVIAKSDSIENLFYRCPGEWVPLDRGADLYSRADVTNNPEPDEGFWMTLERAEELEQ
jgi:hypothetical protein